MLENAIAERDDYRLETLITLRRLERLDKDQYNDDERHEAEDVYNQRVQEEMMNKQELVRNVNFVYFYNTCVLI